MKRLITSCLFLLIITSVFAGDITVLSSRDSGITFDLELPAYNISSVLINNRAYKVINIAGMGFIGETGRPALPVKYVSFALPLNTEGVLAATFFHTDGHAIQFYTIFAYA